MHFSTVAASLMAAAVSAKTIDVGLGNGGKLIFDPDSVTADPGDMINFYWANGFHAVEEGMFSSPCKPEASGFMSMAQMAGPSAKNYTLPINSTNTVWVYCPVGDHCEKGMALVINPSNSTGAPTLAEYQAAAAAGTSTNSTSNSTSTSSGSSSSTSGSASGSTSSASAGSGSGSSTSTGSSSTASKSSEAGLLSLGAGAIAAGVAGVAYML